MYADFEKYRDEKGMTNYQVCKELAIPQSVLSAWKSGRSVPKADKMLLFAALLDAPVEELIRREAT